MPFDLQHARQDTPGCEHVLHFNNAGASLMPRPVLEATIAHLQLEAQIGGYEAAERANDAIEHVYDAAAALIGQRRAHARADRHRAQRLRAAGSGIRAAQARPPRFRLTST